MTESALPDSLAEIRDEFLELDRARPAAAAARVLATSCRPSRPVRRASRAVRARRGVPVARLHRHRCGRRRARRDARDRTARGADDARLREHPRAGHHRTHGRRGARHPGRLPAAHRAHARRLAAAHRRDDRDAHAGEAPGAGEAAAAPAAAMIVTEVRPARSSASTSATTDGRDWLAERYAARGGRLRAAQHDHDPHGLGGGRGRDERDAHQP